MRPASLPLLLGASAAAVTACTIPTTPAADSVPAAFAIQIQNAKVPEVDGRYMNTWAWGGGDFHLFVSPAGNATDTFTLVDGVITLPLDPPRRACINGEYEPKDNTTKLFMTERGDPRAVFTPVWGCREGAADDAPAQLELDGPLRADGSGTVGDMGVREFNGNLDFRWTPRGSDAVDPQRPWTQVRLVVVE